ncbi:unnamed protein product [Amoebophrya sp. A120]|nr:unnamed protein product [Amoebophrya sp. A120]|eukprot:GSA120T00016910001.1
MSTSGGRWSIRPEGDTSGFVLRGPRYPSSSAGLRWYARQRELQSSAVATTDFETRVILFGEGNFSFAAAYAQLHPERHLTATTLESANDVYQLDPEAQNRVEKLQKDGHQVLFGKDYRTYSSDLKKSTKRALIDVDPIQLMLRQERQRGLHDFDIVIFNFPYVRDNGGPATAMLIVDFLVFCNQEAKIGAEIILGLATSRKMTVCCTEIKGETRARAHYKPDQYGKFLQFSAESLVSEALRGSWGAVPLSRHGSSSSSTESTTRETSCALPVLVLTEKDHNFYSKYEQRGYQHVTTGTFEKNLIIWSYNNKTLFRFAVTRCDDVHPTDAYHHCVALSYVPSLTGTERDSITPWLDYHANTNWSIDEDEDRFMSTSLRNYHRDWKPSGRERLRDILLLSLEDQHQPARTSSSKQNLASMLSDEQKLARDAIDVFEIGPKGKTETKLAVLQRRGGGAHRTVADTVGGDGGGDVVPVVYMP